MAFVDKLLSLDLQSWLILILTLIVVAHVVPYFVDPHAIRAFPGPFLAKFTDLWMGRLAVEGHRSEVVHELHKKYGEFVVFPEISEQRFVALSKGHHWVE